MIITNPRSQHYPQLQSYITTDFIEPVVPKMIEVYSDNVVVVRDKNQIIGNADAMITSLRNVLLQVRSCDCGNIYCYDPIVGIVAVCHASWHNTKLNILGKVIATINSLGSQSKDILIRTGPCISGKNYQFGPEVKKLFEPQYYTLEGEHYYLDLPKLHRDQLISSGILAEHIIQSDVCTFDTLTLPSYRRQGPDSGRITGSIMQIS